MKEPLNILLVDDQPAKLLSYEAILHDLGENLIKANSGREALEQLLKAEIPVVLMDVSMPELDGFELAEIIREHPRCRQTAIIFVSAVHLSDLDRLKAYQTGAVDYVSVPIVPEILRAKVSVFTDLYRKTRDAERLNLELESRVSARTAELEEAVARQTALTNLLRDADRRKDEFLALLAHELRNPLAPLLNAVDILNRKSVEDTDIRWCRSVLERQVRQLARLVDDLLDVSRITLGKFKLRNEPIAIGPVIAAAIEISKPMIDEHRHTLAVAVPPEPLYVDGDAARLTQVLTNLLNNAVKYQDDGGSIAVRAAQDGGDVVITVSDSGIGIAPEMLGQVFGLFCQASHVADRAAGGLGVGLSLVKTVVELHGGRVAARSDGSGRGSEFIVRLPLCAAPAAVASPSQPERADRPEPVREILIVDDNIDAAEGLATLLRMGGNRVLLADSGPVALEIVGRTQPDVMLIDIGLPGMDGYEVCRRVRAMGARDAVLIAVTGYGGERDRRRAREAGFDAHEVKPVDFDRLLEVIESTAAAREAIHAP